MRVLIIFDSAFGNTKKIAKAMASCCSKPTTLRMKHIDETFLPDIQAAQIVVVGSPTHGGQPTVPMQQFLKDLPPNVFAKKSVAAFDTRFAVYEHGFGMKVLMKSIGFASPKIAKHLQDLGGKLLVEPQGFIVEDKEGPIRIGELERASDWMKTIKEKYEATTRPVELKR